MEKVEIESVVKESEIVSEIIEDQLKQLKIETEKENSITYSDQNDSPSKIYKLRVTKLPKAYGICEFKKLLNIKLKLNCVKVKTPHKNSNHLYIWFNSEVNKNTALCILNGLNWKRTVLEVSIVNDDYDSPLVQKRIKKYENCLNEQERKEKIKEAEEMMINSVTPLLHMHYEEELIQKTISIRNILLDYAGQLKQANNSQSLLDWLTKQENANNGLPCELLKIQSLKDNLEKCAGYRNKCRFSIGMDVENKEPVIGFRVFTNDKRKTTCVAPIDNVSNVPQRMKDAVNCFQNLVRSSKIPVYDPKIRNGYWRYLILRLGIKTDQLMLICVVYTKYMEVSNLESLKELIFNYFTEGGGAKCNVNSLYIQKSYNPVVNELLYGQENIVEKLEELKFQISPHSFFQVYSTATEILYNIVKDLLSINSQTTILDVCCGSGALSLLFAKDCAQVIGVDTHEESVKIAKLNASENGINNLQFFTGKVEKILISEEFQKPKNTADVVAIVNPPRVGLDDKDILLLREMKHLQKLVYISCDPKMALSHFLLLSMPESKACQGAPFIPIKAVPVNLFPRIQKCELIVYFKRLNTETKMAESSTTPVGSLMSEVDNTNLQYKEKLLEQGWDISDEELYGSCTSLSKTSEIEEDDLTFFSCSSPELE